MRAQMGAAQKHFSDLDQPANGNGHAASPDTVMAHNGSSNNEKPPQSPTNGRPPLEMEPFSNLWHKMLSQHQQTQMAKQEVEVNPIIFALSPFIFRWQCSNRCSDRKR